jgi:nitrite reductase (NADH) small subunit
MTLLENEADPGTQAAVPATDRWIDVCAVDDLTPDRGVCALVDGTAVAVFCCWPDGELFAVGNLDPYSGASVMSRGIVGSIGDRPVVASPIFKHRFDLRSGVSLDDERIALPTFAVQVGSGRVQVSSRPIASPVSDVISVD